MSDQKPHGIPMEAELLYSVYNKELPRVIDRQVDAQPHIFGRFVKKELATELFELKRTWTNNYRSYWISEEWCVIDDGISYPVDISSVRPVYKSARSALIAQLNVDELKYLGLPSPQIVNSDAKMTTLYDLEFHNSGAAHRSSQFMGRFQDRAEAEKLLQAKPGTVGKITEVKCFLSGSTGYKVGAGLKPMTSVREALLEMIAPEYRTILDV